MHQYKIVCPIGAGCWLISHLAIKLAQKWAVVDNFGVIFGRPFGDWFWLKMIFFEIQLFYTAFLSHIFGNWKNEIIAMPSDLKFGKLAHIFFIFSQGCDRIKFTKNFENFSISKGACPQSLFAVPKFVRPPLRHRIRPQGTDPCRGTRGAKAVVSAETGRTYQSFLISSDGWETENLTKRRNTILKNPKPRLSLSHRLQATRP